MGDFTSPTKDRTSAPCIGRQILHHWTTREVLFLKIIEPKERSRGTLIYSQWVFIWWFSLSPSGDGLYQVIIWHLRLASAVETVSIKRCDWALNLWIKRVKETPGRWCQNWIGLKHTQLVSEVAWCVENAHIWCQMYCMVIVGESRRNTTVFFQLTCKHI